MKVIITAGGTGGHIMPAAAIADAVRELKPGTEILFVGTLRGMEERVARKHDIPFEGIDALGIKGKSPLEIVRAAKVNVSALLSAMKIVKSFRPDWVIGTGGYVTGMVVLAGFIHGARCAIQEQNSHAGLTNRLLSRFAHRIFLAFPDDSGVFPKAKTVLTGNPVRKDIVPPEDRGKGDGRLLILGGSLGATSINKAATGAVRILLDQGLSFKVIHQSGQKDYEWVRDAYRDMGAAAEVHDFIEDMSPVYRKAGLAVCRCGGLTLAELSLMGVPAVLVPYPHAADDHQMKNGRYVEAHGGGWVIPDRFLSPERLAVEIKRRFFDENILRETGSRLCSLQLGKGAQIIAEEITGV